MSKFKVDGDLVKKVFGVVAGVAGVISTVDGLYSSHKKDQEFKELKGNYDAIKETLDKLTSEKQG